MNAACWNLRVMEKLPSWLLLPARPTPLILVISFALGLTLAARAGLLGLPLALLLLSWFTKYAYVVLDTAMRGFSEPPVLSVEMVNPANEQRPLGQLLIIGVFYGATAAAEPYIGATAVDTLRLAALALLPACIAVLGSTGSIIKAVNPVVLFTMIRRLGDYYLIVVLAIAAPAALAWAIVNGTFAAFALGVALTSALMMFACLSAFSVIGGVLYERRHELGLDAWKSPERDRAREEREHGRRHERVIDELYGHWRAGARTEARQAAEKWLESRNHAFDEYDWLCERLLAWPDRRLAHRLAQDYIARLLEAKRTPQALNVARRHLQCDADFRPAHAAELIRLATGARDVGDRALARRLLADFGHHYPNDPAAPVAQRLQRELKHEFPPAEKR
jgi:hypothetical protein